MIGQERWEVIEFLNNVVEDYTEIKYVFYSSNSDGKMVKEKLSKFLSDCCGMCPNSDMESVEHLILKSGEEIYMGD